MTENTHLNKINEKMPNMVLTSTCEVSAKTIKLVIKDLQHLEKELVSTMIKETGYSNTDAVSLLEASYDFLSKVQDLKSITHSLFRDENNLYSKIGPNSFVYYQPWGRILTCIPSNAPLPLGIIVPIALLMGGNSVILAPSSKVRNTVNKLGAILTKYFPERIILWKDRVRDAFEHLVVASKIDAVYFMGSSSYYSQITTNCAKTGTKLIYEGEGRGFVVVENDLNEKELENAVKAILDAKTFCNGKMCSAPNVVAVNAKCKEKFINTYNDMCNKYRLPCEVTSLCNSDVDEYVCQIINKTSIIPKTRVKGKKNVPLLIQVSNLSKATEHELFCPICFLYEYKEIDDLIKQLESNRFYLQISMFTKNEKHVKKVIRLTHYARYCLNICPTEQNPLLPWGNYGCSGDSDVLDFYRKGLRRIIIEGNVNDFID